MIDPNVFRAFLTLICILAFLLSAWVIWAVEIRSLWARVLMKLVAFALAAHSVIGAALLILLK